MEAPGPAASPCRLATGVHVHSATTAAPPGRCSPGPRPFPDRAAPRRPAAPALSPGNPYPDAKRTGASHASPTLATFPCNDLERLKLAVLHICGLAQRRSLVWR